MYMDCYAGQLSLLDYISQLAHLQECGDRTAAALTEIEALHGTMLNTPGVGNEEDMNQASWRGVSDEVQRQDVLNAMYKMGR